MATAAAAAKEFVDGPCIQEAVQKLLEAFPLAKLCEALGNAQAADREALISALERLAGFDEVCAGFFGDASVAGFLRQGAASGDSRVTRLVARLLERLAGSDAGVGMLASSGLFEDLEKLLLNEEIETAEAAMRCITRAVMWPAGRDVVVGASGLVPRLQARLRSLRDTEQIRILSLFVELGRASESDVFPALAACGAFKDVLSAFFTDDILLKLNAVELMDALGSYQAGQVLLSQQGVPEQLAKDLVDPCCDDSAKLCVVRLLGFALLREPALMGTLLPSQQAPLAQVMAAFLDSRDVTARLCGLQALSNIAAHQSGLQFVLQWPPVLNMAISMVAAPQNEICKAAMAAWSSLLGPRPRKAAAEGPDADIWKLGEQQVLPSVLKNVSQKPFPDVRCFTWQLLAVFACSEDAARKMLVADEMREQLLNFSSESAPGVSTNDAKIAKHQFVQALVAHQGKWLAAFLDPNLEMMLTEYSKQGPYWMPQVSAVNVADQGAM